VDLTPIQLKFAKAALGFSAVVLVTSASFLFGITQGENNITVRWQKEKLEHSQEMAVLQGKIEQKEFGHRQETARISEQLRKTEVDYEKATSALAAEHAQRLRLASERAAAYARLAETGSPELRGLASHAAQLDASLEEGRGLVGELKEALGRRDNQLKLLGAQINNDRTLLDAR
jgi:chromosome segregation ATPase